MTKNILSVGYVIPGGEVEHLNFRSDRSLLDADIILFQPMIPYYSGQTFQGKTALSEKDSFGFTENIKHWSTELSIAANAGKTVVIFLPELSEAYIHTGQKTYSGTGRGRITTNLLSLTSNYESIPFKLGNIIPKGGKEIRTKGNLGVLTHYWKEFGAYSPYNVYFQDTINGTCLVTKTGEKTVAAVIPNSYYVLIPSLRYPEDFIEDVVEDDDGRTVTLWTTDAVQFGKRYIAELIRIDHLLHEGKETSLAPEWTFESTYILNSEKRLLKQVDKTLKQIEELSRKKDELLELASGEGILRRLLYEQGHPLENAIIEALNLMGFEAENVSEGDSEFDVVFISPEGRFLGEAEGKDNKPINIDKFSQLERNINEDFARDDITRHAKGVLFGNAFRFELPSKRGEFFTEKCLSAAKRTGVALVRTPDLFEVAKYLKDNSDLSFAQKCREAIASTAGDIVQFPKVQKSSKVTT